MNKKILYLSVVFILLPTLAQADYCAPSIGSGIVKKSLEKQQSDLKNIEDLTNKKQDEINSTDSTFSCSDVWSSPSVSVSFQNVVDLLKKAGEKAVSAACNAAKDKVQEAASKASQNASLNTSNIPGLSDLGLGTLGTISTGSGSTGGVSVNGDTTTWEGMANLFK
ncbi:hypothetical protein [Erwinia amylovora]|uniref:hypothetical protein n=1 Tax=Erwinia amylovora TaxID=552 RepID=UPI0014445D2C|nr:hypothetical protein [Erwinia amylovora]